MRKSKFTEEQIIRALREVDAGAKVQDVIRGRESPAEDDGGVPPPKPAKNGLAKRTG